MFLWETSLISLQNLREHFNVQMCCKFFFGSRVLGQTKRFRVRHSRPCLCPCLDPLLTISSKKDHRRAGPKSPCHCASGGLKHTCKMGKLHVFTALDSTTSSRIRIHKSGVNLHPVIVGTRWREISKRLGFTILLLETKVSVPWTLVVTVRIALFHID